MNYQVWFLRDAGLFHLYFTSQGPQQCIPRHNNPSITAEELVECYICDNFFMTGLSVWVNKLQWMHAISDTQNKPDTAQVFMTFKHGEAMIKSSLMTLNTFRAIRNHTTWHYAEREIFHGSEDQDTFHFTWPQQLGTLRLLIFWKFQGWL